MNTKSYTTPLSVKSVAELASKIGILDQSFTEQKDEDYNQHVHQFSLGLFTLVVMGEIKKGKSSFINALLGQPDLVPVQSDIATSTLFKIHYGTEITYRVHFHKAADKEILPITRKELDDYGTETGNPRNCKQVEFIAVSSPSRLLEDGLVIVDTPGVGGLFKVHRELTFQYAPKADAVIFVTDMSAPIGSEEVSFLKELRQTTDMIYFVQTKSDTGDVETVARMMKNNKNILCAEVGITEQELVLFSVSALAKNMSSEVTGCEEKDFSKKEKFLTQSGYIPFLKFFHTQARKQREVKNYTNILALIGSKLNSVEQAIDSNKRILDSDTNESVEALEEELDQAIRLFDDWNTNQREALNNEFIESLHGFWTDANYQLNELLKPGGKFSQEIQEKLESMKSAHDIYQDSNAIINDLCADSSKTILQVIDTLESNVKSLLVSLSIKCGAQITSLPEDSHYDHELQRLSTMKFRDISSKADDSRIFEKSRSTVYGGLFGITGAAMVGGIVGSVVPVVGTAIGSLGGTAITGMWGAFKGFEYQNKSEAKEAKMEMQRLVDQALSSCQNIALTELSSVRIKVERSADSAFKKMIADLTEKLNQQKKEIQGRLKMNQDEYTKKRRELEEKEKMLKDCKSSLLSFSNSVERMSE